MDALSSHVNEARMDGWGVQVAMYGEDTAMASAMAEIIRCIASAALPRLLGGATATLHRKHTARVIRSFTALANRAFMSIPWPGDSLARAAAIAIDAFAFCKNAPTLFSAHCFLLLYCMHLGIVDAALVCVPTSARTALVPGVVPTTGIPSKASRSMAVTDGDGGAALPSSDGPMVIPSMVPDSLLHALALADGGFRRAIGGLSLAAMASIVATVSAPFSLPAPNYVAYRLRGASVVAAVMTWAHQFAHASDETSDGNTRDGSESGGDNREACNGMPRACCCDDAHIASAHAAAARVLSHCRTLCLVSMDDFKGGDGGDDDDCELPNTAADTEFITKMIALSMRRSAVLSSEEKRVDASGNDDIIVTPCYGLPVTVLMEDRSNKTAQILHESSLPDSWTLEGVCVILH